MPNQAELALWAAQAQIQGRRYIITNPYLGTGGALDRWNYGEWHWLDDGPTGGAITATPPNESVVTGISPNELANALYGKVIPLSCLGLARIGVAGLIWGPERSGDTASFAVSFGFATNVTGDRKVYQIALDNKVVWENDIGSAPGAIHPSGFISEAFTCRFYGGSLTQGADPLTIAKNGAEAVAYRPQMMLWFENLPLAQFNNRVPFVSAVIGDTTDGAEPADGINIGEAFERVAYSPFLEYTTDTFETVGTEDIIQAMILSESQSFLSMMQTHVRVFRSLDILQTDKLRVIDRGSTVTPDLVLDRDRILDSGVTYNRREESSVSREFELITIDPEADYVLIPSKASRPRHPVPVTSSVGKESITLPVVISATKRASLAAFAKYAEETSRKTIRFSTLLYGYELEPGGLVGISSLRDGFAAETFKIVDTSHGANYTVEITAEAILKCAIEGESVPIFSPLYWAENSSGYELSQSDLTAEHMTGVPQGVRANQACAGKCVFAIHLDSVREFMGGISKTSHDLDAVNLGDDSRSVVYDSGVGIVSWNNTSLATYATIGQSEIMLCAVDMLAGDIWFGKIDAAGTVTWNGDPGAGTGAVKSDLDNGPWYPTAGIVDSSPASSRVTIVPVPTAAVPTGFTAMDPDGAGTIWVGSFWQPLNTDGGDLGAAVNIRQELPASVLGRSGSSVRLTFEASAGESCTFSHVVIGEKAASGDAWDIQAGTLTQVTFDSGSASKVIPAGQRARSDTITFTLDASKTYHVGVFYGGGSGSDNMRARASGLPQHYKFTVTDETSTPDVTGYTTIGSLRGLVGVEVLF